MQKVEATASICRAMSQRSAPKDGVPPKTECPQKQSAPENGVPPNTVHHGITAALQGL